MASFDLTRAFVSAFVTRTLRDIERDPERSIRNLVDLAERFSRGRFQRHFLESAQRMLQNPDSSYYTTVKNVVTRVRPKALSTFGVNLGYNGLTRGARIIREKEREIGVNIPWMLSLDYAPEESPEIPAYGALIGQGKGLGIFVYAFFVEEAGLAPLLPLLEDHPDCAFALFLRPPLGSPKSLAPLAALPHIMAVLPFQDPLFAPAAQGLRASANLFSGYAAYGPEEAAAFARPEWMAPYADSGCVFAFLVAEEAVGTSTREALWQAVCDLREAQTQVLIPMEFYSDLLFIDQVISTQPCYLGFDSRGNTKTLGGLLRDRFHFPSTDLQTLLQNTMPRATYFTADPAGS